MNAATDAQSTVTVTPLTLEDESFIVMGRDVIDVFGLECDVCKDLFDRQAKLPKLLPCNHTLCRACLDTITATRFDEMEDEDASDDEDHSITTVNCPQCKQTFSSEKVQSLPNDCRVLKGLDVIRKARVTFKNVCFKHDCQKLDRFCKTCEMPVCTDCISLLHTEENPEEREEEKEEATGLYGLSSFREMPVCTDCISLLHTEENPEEREEEKEEATGLYGLSSFREANNHPIIDLIQALEYMAIDDLERQCTTSLEQRKVNHEIIRNIKHRLRKHEKDQMKKIEERFDHYSKILLERKETLINLIKDMAKKDLSDINLEIRTCEESTNELQRLYNRFTSSRENEDVRQMFKLRKQIIGNDLLKVSSTESLCKTIEFQAVNGDRFESDLGTLGNVATKIDLKLQCPEPESRGQISQALFQFSAP